MSGPPPPPPPPPPILGSAAPSVTQNVPPPSMKGRDALLNDIRKGKSLKKAETNDRSAPLVVSSSSGIASTPATKSPATTISAAPAIPGSFPSAPQLGDILAGGIPKLRSVSSNKVAPNVPSSGAPPIPGSHSNATASASNLASAPVPPPLPTSSAPEVPKIPKGRPTGKTNRKASSVKNSVPSAPPLPSYSSNPAPTTAPSIPDVSRSLAEAIPTKIASQHSKLSAPGSQPSSNMPPIAAPPIPQSAPPLPTAAVQVDRTLSQEIRQHGAPNLAVQPNSSRSADNSSATDDIPSSSQFSSGLPFLAEVNARRSNKGMIDSEKNDLVMNSIKDSGTLNGTSKSSPMFPSAPPPPPPPPPPPQATPELPFKSAPSVNTIRTGTEKISTVPLAPPPPPPPTMAIPAAPAPAIPAATAPSIPIQTPTLIDTVAPTEPYPSNQRNASAPFPPAPPPPPPMAISASNNKSALSPNESLKQPATVTSAAAEPSGQLPFLAEIQKKRDDRFVVGDESNYTTKVDQFDTSANTESHNSVDMLSDPGKSTSFINEIQSRMVQHHNTSSNPRSEPLAPSTSAPPLPAAQAPSIPLPDASHGQTTLSNSIISDTPIPPSLPTYSSPPLPNATAPPLPVSDIPFDNNSQTLPAIVQNSISDVSTAIEQPITIQDQGSSTDSAGPESTQVKKSNFKQRLFSSGSKLQTSVNEHTHAVDIDLGSYTIAGSAQNDHDGDSERIRIDDSRFKWTDESQIPKPRNFTYKKKLYPSGKGSSVPLKLSAYS